MRALVLLLSLYGLLFGTYVRNNTNETVYDSSTDLTWQDNAVVTTQTQNWYDAVDYCNNLVFAEVDDWYLPSFDELNGIVDTSNIPTYDDAFVSVAQISYWSSTTYVASTTDYALGIYFGNGYDGIGLKSHDYFFARCVRSGPIINVTPEVVYENEPAGAVFGTLVTDMNNTYEANLTCNDANFSISGNSLVSNVVFDYETTPTQTVCIRVKDSTNLIYEGNFTVAIANVPPTDINLSTNSIAENHAIGSVVGTLDANEGVTSYSFCGGSDDAEFEINGTTLQTAAVLDYESGIMRNVCIRATDAANASYDENLTVMLLNIDESAAGVCGSSDGKTFTDAPATGLCSVGTASVVSAGSSAYEWRCNGVTVGSDTGADTNCSAMRNYPPGDIFLSAAVVVENSAAGMPVGSLSSDENVTGFSFCGGADDAEFTISGSTLLSAAVFDFESAATRSVCIRATDTFNATFDKTFVIMIVNQNESSDGLCGAADGGTFINTPADNLCDAGTTTAVSEGVNSFTWYCLGSSVGSDTASDANCSAARDYSVSVPLFGLPGAALLALLMGLSGYYNLTQRNRL